MKPATAAVNRAAATISEACTTMATTVSAGTTMSPSIGTRSSNATFPAAAEPPARRRTGRPTGPCPTAASRRSRRPKTARTTARPRKPECRTSPRSRSGSRSAQPSIHPTTERRARPASAPSAFAVSGAARTPNWRSATSFATPTRSRPCAAGRRTPGARPIGSNAACPTSSSAVVALPKVQGMTSWSYASVLGSHRGRARARRCCASASGTACRGGETARYEHDVSGQESVWGPHDVPLEAATSGAVTERVSVQFGATNCIRLCAARNHVLVS